MATLLKFPSPPVRTPLLQPAPSKNTLRYEDRSGKQKPTSAPTPINRPWIQHLQAISDKLTAPINTVTSTPEEPFLSNSPAVQNQIATDGTYLYVSVGPNQWKRVALIAF